MQPILSRQLSRIRGLWIRTIYEPSIDIVLAGFSGGARVLLRERLLPRAPP